MRPKKLIAVFVVTLAVMLVACGGMTGLTTPSSDGGNTSLRMTFWIEIVAVDTGLTVSPDAADIYTLSRDLQYKAVVKFHNPCVPGRFIHGSLTTGWNSFNHRQEEMSFFQCGAGFKPPTEEVFGFLEWGKNSITKGRHPLNADLTEEGGDLDVPNEQRKEVLLDIV